MADHAGPPTMTDSYRPVLYGQVPAEDWLGRGRAAAEEPWRSFGRALELSRAGAPDDAAARWGRLAADRTLATHHRLQAWHLLRQSGLPPPDSLSRRVLGAVVEVPVGDGHDVLAAYDDGRARHLDHGGSLAVLEDRSLVAFQHALRSWLEAGHAVAEATDPWTGASLPHLPVGHLRASALTPGGPRFAQGPAPALAGDPRLRPFLGAAWHLRAIVVGEVGQAGSTGAPPRPGEHHG